MTSVHSYYSVINYNIIISLYRKPWSQKTFLAIKMALEQLCDVVQRCVRVNMFYCTFAMCQLHKVTCVFIFYLASNQGWRLLTGRLWFILHCRKNLYRARQQCSGSQHPSWWDEQGELNSALCDSSMKRPNSGSFILVLLKNIVSCMGWNLLGPLVQILLKKEDRNLPHCHAILSHLLEVICDLFFKLWWDIWLWPACSFHAAFIYSVMFCETGLQS